MAAVLTQKRIELSLILFTVLLFYFYLSYNKFTSKTPAVPPMCVPDHFFMQEVLASRKGQIRSIGETSMKIIAAYDYMIYSVVTTEALGWYGKPVFCRYMDEMYNEVGPAVPSVMFPEAIVYCCSRANATFMSVTKGPDDPLVDIAQIIDRQSKAPRYFLSHCLAPIYGNQSKWLMLVEFFEHYKLQGVEHFYVYIKEIDAYSNRLIEDYVRRGEVEVIHLQIKEPLHIIHTQLIGVADCLQRSRHHSRYAFFADLDERVLPQPGERLVDIVRKRMPEVPNRAMMRLTSRWVLRTPPPQIEYMGKETLRKHLPMLVFHNSSAVPPRRIIEKCILDPTRVLIHFVHRVRAFYPGYEAYDVDFNEIHIRHYRDVSSGSWSKEWLERLARFGPFENTSYPSEHMERLLENVKERLDKTYL